MKTQAGKQVEIGSEVLVVMRVRVTGMKKSESIWDKTTATVLDGRVLIDGEEKGGFIYGIHSSQVEDVYAV